LSSPVIGAKSRQPLDSKALKAAITTLRYSSRSTIRAGAPITVAPAGTSLVTTAPAPKLLGRRQQISLASADAIECIIGK
jgi:hypothetical protein